MHTNQSNNVETYSNTHHLDSTANNPTSNPEAHDRETSAARKPLPAGQWLRAVMGFEAPFGHDGLPTVWG